MTKPRKPAKRVTRRGRPAPTKNSTAPRGARTGARLNSAETLRDDIRGLEVMALLAIKDAPDDWTRWRKVAAKPVKDIGKSLVVTPAMVALMKERDAAPIAVVELAKSVQDRVNAAISKRAKSKQPPRVLKPDELDWRRTTVLACDRLRILFPGFCRGWGCVRSLDADAAMPDDIRERQGQIESELDKLHAVRNHLLAFGADTDEPVTITTAAPPPRAEPRDNPEPHPRDIHFNILRYLVSVKQAVPRAAIRDALERQHGRDPLRDAVTEMNNWGWVNGAPRRKTGVCILQAGREALAAHGANKPDGSETSQKQRRN